MRNELDDFVNGILQDIDKMPFQEQILDLELTCRQVKANIFDWINKNKHQMSDDYVELNKRRANAFFEISLCFTELTDRFPDYDKISNGLNTTKDLFNAYRFDFDEQIRTAKWRGDEETVNYILSNFHIPILLLEKYLTRVLKAQGYKIRPY